MLYSCTNTAAARIAQAGLLQKDVAQAVGISRYTLRNKLHRGQSTRAMVARQIAREYARATGSSEAQAFNELFEEIREPARHTAATYASTGTTSLAQAGLTQAALARQAGLDPALLNRILRKRQAVSGRLAWKLACAYATTRHISADQAFTTLFTSVTP